MSSSKQFCSIVLIFFFSKCRLHHVFPQGLGFVLVFEFMVSDLSELLKDADQPLTEPEVGRTE